MNLTRLTFPFLFFVSLSSFFSGILNSKNKFAAAAAAPIILNIILILSLFISYFFNLNFEFNLSFAVSIAGFIQLIFLVFVTKFYYKPTINFKINLNPRVKFFLKNYFQAFFHPVLLK